MVWVTTSAVDSEANGYSRRRFHTGTKRPTTCLQVTTSADDLWASAAPGRMASKEAVWKFGYGSNMSQDFLRTKKALDPLDCAAPSAGLSAELSSREGNRFC